MKKFRNYIVVFCFIALSLLISGCHNTAPQTVNNWVYYREGIIPFSSLDTSLKESELEEFPDLTIRRAEISKISDNCYLIKYILTDSTNQEFEQLEELELTEGNEIRKSYLYFEEWQRVNYFAPTIEELLNYLEDSLVNKNYEKLLSLVHELSYSELEERRIANIDYIEYSLISCDPKAVRIIINCSSSDSSIILTGKHEYNLSIDESSKGYYIRMISMAK